MQNSNPKLFVLMEKIAIQNEDSYEFWRYEGGLESNLCLAVNKKLA